MHTQKQKQPSRVVKDQLRKMKGHLEVLQTLFLNVYGSYMFLRPLFADKELVRRLSRGPKAPGFSQLLDTLYWHFILDLVKIWRHPDHQQEKDRSCPNLLNITAKLNDEQIVSLLQEFYLLADRFDDPIEREKEFVQRCQRIRRITAQMCKTNSLLARYATIRDKLIAHNEAHVESTGYSLFPIKQLGLKYGQEKLLLESARVVIDDLNAVVLDKSFSWDDFFSLESRHVADFWDIPISSQWSPPFTKSAERIFRRMLDS